jgi:hypothetical protein
VVPDGAVNVVPAAQASGASVSPESRSQPEPATP